jgi:Holliday junction resolvasome RuvABC endonuclease subunit
MRYAIGIDPGGKGAFAIISEDRTRIRCVRFKDMTKKDIVRVFERYGSLDAAVAIEKVHGYRGQAAGASFTFGRNTGLLDGALLAFDYSYQEVEPKVWQRAIGMRAKGYAAKADRKKALHQLAQQYFDKKDFRVTADMADALLIAQYVWQLTFQP